MEEALQRIYEARKKWKDIAFVFSQGIRSAGIVDEDTDQIVDQTIDYIVDLIIQGKIEHHPDNLEQKMTACLKVQTKIYWRRNGGRVDHLFLGEGGMIDILDNKDFGGSLDFSVRRDYEYHRIYEYERSPERRIKDRERQKNRYYELKNNPEKYRQHLQKRYERVAEREREKKLGIWLDRRKYKAMLLPTPTPDTQGEGKIT